MSSATRPGVVHLERYWLPAGSTYSLTGSGWLVGPIEGWLHRPSSDAVRTQDLADKRCVVLLGEPGMGKTSAIHANEPLKPSGASVNTLNVDLGTFSSEDRLARQVFESDQIKEWLAGQNMLCLTFDSFDEAHSRIENLPRMLGQYLDGWDCERLLLRIACRTAGWPSSLRPVLDRKFGQTDIHELLPLRREDAAILLSAAGVEAQEFLAAVERAHVVPLAARPLTLNLLRGAVRPDGSFPASASELYADGLLTLADEMNAERRDATRSIPDASNRLAVATRMAAISVFGGRPSIWTGPIAQAEPADITVDDCMVAEGTTRGTAFSSELVDATLQTGLFTGNGENRLGWAHATFADYLAGRWIVSNGINHEQVRSILLSHDGRVHARCRQVAGWLVGIAPEQFRWLIPCDPEAFLSNVDIPEEALRHELVAGLLDEVRAGSLYYDYRLDLTGLVHAGLAQQLRLALAESAQDIVRIAISIARQCLVVDVIPDLASIALDPDVDTHLRASAAMAVHDLSVEDPTHELATLLSSNARSTAGGDALPWELEAAALMASWPHAISTPEVFELLNPRHPRNHMGLYSVFVNDFAQRLTHDDLDVACDWVASDSARLNDSRVAVVINAIVRLCLKNLDELKAREAVKQIAFRRAEDYEPLFSDEAFTTEPELTVDNRRALALLLLEDATQHQVFSIVDFVGGHGLSLIRSDDFVWLVEQYKAAQGPLRDNVATAITHIHDPANITHSDLVLGLPPDHPGADLFTYWRSVIELNSPEAIAARNVWQEHAERRQRNVDRRAEGRDQWVNPQIEDEAEKARAGDTKAFWNAVQLVTVRPGTQRYMDQYKPDLASHPRWATLPEQTRDDLLEACPHYLMHARCEPEKWLAKDVMFYPAHAAYRALILLLRERPEELERLPGAAWKEWAPILVDWTATINGAQAADKHALLNLAARHAPDELNASLLILIDKAIDDGGHIFVRAELAALMSEPLAQSLVARLPRPMQAEPRDGILDALMENHADLIRPLLLDWLAPPQRTSDPGRARAAVMRLLYSDVAQAWSVLGELLDSDPEFMESAFLANGFAYERQVPNLGESELADLYIWIRRHFPADEDPHLEDAHIVGAREALGSWRDSLLEHLRQLGTEEAVGAVKRIVLAFPEHAWLNHALIDARGAFREASWEPLSPHELDQLASSREARIVRTDADLLTATLAALEDIQMRLQGDTPSANLLWDTHSGRPKAEDEISDYLSIELGTRLREHGTVVNREVQVRRIKPTGLPERTDLRIEALPHDGDSTGALQIPGEVKGAWNSGVITSVETQLVQRYMADFHTNHGVYIVAWFDQESWTDRDDGRKGKAATHATREDLVSALEDQAAKQRSQGRTVAVFVLDASLRRSGPAMPDS